MTFRPSTSPISTRRSGAYKVITAPGATVIVDPAGAGRGPGRRAGSSEPAAVAAKPAGRGEGAGAACRGPRATRSRRRAPPPAPLRMRDARRRLRAPLRPARPLLGRPRLPARPRDRPLEAAQGGAPEARRDAAGAARRALLRGGRRCSSPGSATPPSFGASPTPRPRRPASATRNGARSGPRRTAASTAPTRSCPATGSRARTPRLPAKTLRDRSAPHASCCRRNLVPVPLPRGGRPRSGRRPLGAADPAGGLPARGTSSRPATPGPSRWRRILSTGRRATTSRSRSPSRTAGARRRHRRRPRSCRIPPTRPRAGSWRSPATRRGSSPEPLDRPPPVRPGRVAGAPRVPGRLAADRRAASALAAAALALLLAAAYGGRRGAWARAAALAALAAALLLGAASAARLPGVRDHRGQPRRRRLAPGDPALDPDGGRRLPEDDAPAGGKRGDRRQGLPRLDPPRVPQRGDGVDPPERGRVLWGPPEVPPAGRESSHHPRHRFLRVERGHRGDSDPGERPRLVRHGRAAPTGRPQA